MDDDNNKVSLRIGDVWAYPQGSGHIYVRLDPDKDSCHSDRLVTVRGVGLKGSFHMWLWDDGYWHVGMQYAPGHDRRPLNDYERRRDMYINRRDGTMTDGTSAAKDTLIQQAEPFINDWAKAHPYVLFMAETKALEAVRDRAARLHDEAAQALTNAMEAHKKAEQALHVHLTTHPAISLEGSKV